jgi:hypothetical protein
MANKAGPKELTRTCWGCGDAFSYQVGIDGLYYRLGDLTPVGANWAGKDYCLSCFGVESNESEARHDQSTD